MGVPLWVKQCYWTLAGLGLLYVLGVLTLTIPVVQRNATYAHNLNPARWQNLSNVNQFGFIHDQVQPFTIRTTDGELIYAWHILPIQLYQQHEEALKASRPLSTESFEEASSRLGLQLMLNDPQAVVMVSFHGNAAHLASAQRPATYQQSLGLSTAIRPVHVVAFDYRGFGLSSGSPTEEGVTLDAITLLSCLTGYHEDNSIQGQESLTKHVRRHLNPSQIILVGQSLGTFVSTSAYYEWTIKLGRPAFRGLFLMASFTSLPKLLDSYSIKGWTPPLLSPLIGYPSAQRWVMSKIIDKWDTARRLVELVQARDIPLELSIMHARDDWEIPWREGRGNWNAIMDAVGESAACEERIAEGVDSIDLQTWQSMDKATNVRWERIEHGGHNKVATGEHARLTLLRMLEDKLQSS